MGKKQGSNYPNVCVFLRVHNPEKGGRRYRENLKCHTEAYRTAVSVVSDVHNVAETGFNPLFTGFVICIHRWYSPT